jgi:hypothetical protein
MMPPYALIYLHYGMVSNRYSELLNHATLFCKLASKSNTRILYHIGPHPASPKPKRYQLPWSEEKDEGKNPYTIDPAYTGKPGWERDWLPEPIESGVFLSPNPVDIGINHGMRGNVYAYKVPEWVINEAGGIHRYDHGSEIIISEKLWNKAKKDIKFLGKVADKKKFDKKLFHMYRNNRDYSMLPYNKIYDSKLNNSTKWQKLFNFSPTLMLSPKTIEQIKILGKEFVIEMLNNIDLYTSQLATSPERTRGPSNFGNKLNQAKQAKTILENLISELF